MGEYSDYEGKKNDPTFEMSNDKIETLVGIGMISYLGLFYSWLLLNHLHIVEAWLNQVTVSALLNFYFIHVKLHSLDEYGVSGYVINTDYNEF